MLFDDYMTIGAEGYILGVLRRFETVRTINQTFAIDNTFLKALDADALPCQAVIHFWPTEPAVYLGMQDTRLPHLDEAVKILSERGYHPMVRPAGGLAVVGDPDVINFTLLFKADKKHPSSAAAYQLMLRLLNAMFHPFHQTARDGEVRHSYCPGRYDVSIGGKKIAGLSQRRVGDAVGIYAYLALAGDQNARCQLLQDFYAVGAPDAGPESPYPTIDARVMGTLAQFIPSLANIESFEDRMLQTLELLEPGMATMPLFLEALNIKEQLIAEAKRNERLTDHFISPDIY